jgi:peptide/nickel transport system permease protein
MAAYVVRRLAWTVLVLFLITVITFVLSHVVPANPAVTIAGLGASTEQVKAVQKELGLDKPLPTQYRIYMQGLAKFDLGTSARTRRPVTKDFRTFLPATFELMVVSFVVYMLVALTLGLFSAIRPGGALDYIIRFLSISTSSVPAFWLAMMLQLIFFARLGLMPSGGRIGVREAPPPHVIGFFTVDSLLAGDFNLFRSVVSHMILPVAAIVLSMLAVGVRMTRASVIQEMGQQYVRTARSKGLKERAVLVRHVLRNALNPVISVFGIQLGYLLAWIILVETIFQWPGIGLYAFNSFQGFDYGPIMSLTLLLSFFFVLVNLATDLLYPVLDPRIR